MVETEEIKDLLQSLIKAKKNLRLYPENNPIYKKTIDTIYGRISSAVEAEGSLTFRIRQYDIFLQDDLIYHNEDKEESLSLFFFKDGVREITFKQGIPLEEVEDFLKIISMDFDKEALDDDVVTLMWERDFHFIDYLVDDTILLEDEGYEEMATKEAKGAYAGGEEVLRAYDDALGIERSSAISIVPLTNNDLKSIIEEIENEPTDKTFLLMQILFDMLAEAQGKAEFQEITDFMKKTIVYSISHGNLDTVIYTIKKIRNSIKRSLYPDEVNPYLKGVDYHLNSAGCILALGDILDSGAEFEADTLHEFSHVLSKASIPPLISLLGELKNISSRKAVIKIISELGKQDINAVANGLSDRRWYVVRNIIYILRQIGDRRAIEYLTRSIRHPDKRVRKEAIRALGEMGSGDVVSILKGCLTDSDESIRVAAVRAIGHIGTIVSKKIITDCIRGKDFRDPSFSEKREYFETLARWPEGDTEELVLRVLKKQTFFKRIKNDETRAAAAYCAALIGSKEAAGILEKLKDSKNRILKEHVISAINRLNNGKI